MPDTAPLTTIRPATMADATAITALCDIALGHPTTVDALVPRLRAALADATHLILVAEDDSGVVGYAHACSYDQLYYPHMTDLLTIAVVPKAQKRGTGKLLLAAIEQWALAAGAVAVRVISGEARLDAHYFYRSAGYGDERGRRRFVKKLRSNTR